MAVTMRNTGDRRPPLAVVAREGDARGALAIAVTTAGVAPDRGALVGVSLAALAEARLAARGIEANAIGGFDGWRLRILIGSPAEAAKVVEGLRSALLAPVASDEPALAAVGRKALALARRPVVDRALVDVAQCTGEAYGMGNDVAPMPAELESWRAAANGLGRVAVATAGDASLGDAAARALARAGPWPRGAPLLASPWPPLDSRTTVYDGSGEIAPGAARVVVTVRTATPERAAAVAPWLGDPHGPLASRLAALEAPGRVRSVVATAHVDGGCLATTIDLAPQAIASDAPARIATAAALARQELIVEITDVAVPADLGRALAMRASDPRDAAERAAWWSLAGRRPGAADDDRRVTLAVGVAPSRDATEPIAARAESIRAEIDRATLAWHAPVVEARTHVERGQGETWVLLASTCGTLPEGPGDAGVGAAVVEAASAQAAGSAAGAKVEPFVAIDGVGVLVHGPALTGESSPAHARRLADIAARAFAADSLDPAHVARARTALLARAAQPSQHAFGLLAGALAPSHASWLEPAGTSLGLASASDDAIAMRAAAIRAGPLRAAVLANTNAAQADAAVRAVDRWVARRPGESRACTTAPAVAAPRPGTYAVELPAAVPSEALIAIPLAPADDASRASAMWLAASLDGPAGLLARTLGKTGGDPLGSGLARGWSAALVGGSRAAALVIRLVASDASLDAAVAQIRALLDRLRQGALREDDRARAAVSLERARVAASLDPRARVIDLWRGQPPPPAPSLETLRAFAAATLRDEALVIVAARPARVDPGTRPSPSKEPKAKSLVSFEGSTRSPRDPQPAQSEDTP
jgi:hypothetical protein